MKNKFLTFTALLLLVGTSSCKKDGAKITPQSDCIITSIEIDPDGIYDIIYDGELVTSLKQTNGDDEDKLFYNSDKLLSLREYYTNDKLRAIDTFYYDASKRLTTVLFYEINSSGNRVLSLKESFEYNSSNQIILYKDSSIYDSYKILDVHVFEYNNNRRFKETISTYENDLFYKKSEILYSYTTIKNSFQTIFNQSYLVITSNPLFLGDFENTDLLVSQLDIKDFDENNTLEDEYSIKFDYTLENGNVKTVSMDEYGEILKFNYKCD